MKEWNPYIFAPNGSECEQHGNFYIFPPFKEDNRIEPPNERVKGADFCLWSDTPSAKTEDEILENIRPYFTAIAKKSTGNV